MTYALSFTILIEKSYTIIIKAWHTIMTTEYEENEVAKTSRWPILTHTHTHTTEWKTQGKHSEETVTSFNAFSNGTFMTADSSLRQEGKAQQNCEDWRMLTFSTAYEHQSSRYIFTGNIHVRICGWLKHIYTIKTVGNPNHHRSSTLWNKIINENTHQCFNAAIRSDDRSEMHLDRVLMIFNSFDESLNIC